MALEEQLVDGHGDNRNAGKGIEDGKDDKSDKTYYVLVTGTNSGLGFAICCRLIDDFLRLYPSDTALELVFTTRSKRKSHDAAARLRKHIAKAVKKAGGAGPATPNAQSDTNTTTTSNTPHPRIALHPELVDLSSITSVQNLASRLRRSLPKLHALVLNAAVGGFTGIDWLDAVWGTLTDTVHAITYPTMVRAGVGLLAERQLGGGGAGGDAAERRADMAEKELLLEKGSRAGVDGIRAEDDDDDDGEDPEPPLGAVFAANVFGHYLLSHYLMPLLAAADPFAGLSPTEQHSIAQACDHDQNQDQNRDRDHDTAPPRGGRVVWMSSVEAYAHALDVAHDDLQGLRHELAYHSSKRVTDLLVLTSEMASTRPWVDAFLAWTRDDTSMDSSLSEQDHHRQQQQQQQQHPRRRRRPTLYVAHPGICSTSIMPLPAPAALFMVLVFWLARLLGSPWHTISSYSGAAAPVWLALAPQPVLDAAEHDGQRKGKWGSGVAVGAGCEGKSEEERGRIERVVGGDGAVVVRRTEVEGWGWSGVVGEADEGRVVGRGTRTGRWRGATELTGEAREEFEVLGRRCWGEMERLRREWEGRLRERGVGVDMD